VGDSVQVTVEKDLNTVAPSDVARRILDLIQENLG
jgi:outer membrane protein assembly factor BamC